MSLDAKQRVAARTYQVLGGRHASAYGKRGPIPVVPLEKSGLVQLLGKGAGKHLEIVARTLGVLD